MSRRHAVISLWNLATCKEVTSLRGHGEVMYGVAFTADGRALVFGGCIRFNWPGLP